LGTFEQLIDFLWVLVQLLFVLRETHASSSTFGTELFPFEFELQSYLSRQRAQNKELQSLGSHSV
jgi:hypothetical protein